MSIALGLTVVTISTDFTIFRNMDCCVSMGTALPYISVSCRMPLNVSPLQSAPSCSQDTCCSSFSRSCTSSHRYGAGSLFLNTLCLHSIGNTLHVDVIVYPRYWFIVVSICKLHCTHTVNDLLIKQLTFCFLLTVKLFLLLSTSNSYKN